MMLWTLRCCLFFVKRASGPLLSSPNRPRADIGSRSLFVRRRFIKKTSSEPLPRADLVLPLLISLQPLPNTQTLVPILHSSATSPAPPFISDLPCSSTSSRRHAGLHPSPSRSPPPFSTADSTSVEATTPPSTPPRSDFTETADAPCCFGQWFDRKISC
ncbi:hypothetical protein HanIR_Chr06g0262521 [Helianthus annuus]|nr:hypothetical protein HanIR_Chr06g0262521 [Helianthus annuus]